MCLGSQVDRGPFFTRPYLLLGSALRRHPPVFFVDWSGIAPSSWRRFQEEWSCRPRSRARRRGHKRGVARKLTRMLGRMRTGIRALRRGGRHRSTAPCSRRYGSRSTKCPRRQKPRGDRVPRSSFPTCGVGDIAFAFALDVCACRSKRSGGSGW